MLTRVEFQNLKSLADVTVDLAPFTVLVGPNGCGKSTVLDEIQSLCVFSHPEESGGHTLGNVSVWLNARDPTEWRTVDGVGPSVWLARNEAGPLLSVKIEAGPARRWYERTTVSVQVDGKVLTLTHSNTGDHRAPMQEQLGASFSWRCQRLRLVPGRITDPVDIRHRTLDADGFGLASVLSALANVDQDAYAAVQADLRAVVPSFEKFSPEIVEVGTSTGVTAGGVALGMVMRGAKRVPARQVSDGTLMAAALLTATHNRTAPSLILMDDIDHGLHLEAQLEMIKAIRAVMQVRPELQVICTTHSPYLLHDVGPEEVQVMALDGQGRTRLKPLTDHPEVDRLRSVMTAGELWANLGERWVLED